MTTPPRDPAADGPGPDGPGPDGPGPDGPGPGDPGPGAPDDPRDAAPDDLGDGPEERDSGLARERTALSWTRTAIAFAALGGVVLKENVITGLVVLAIAPVVWQLGRATRTTRPEPGGQLGPGSAVDATRLFLISASIVVVALLCLVIAILGRSAPGALR